MRKKSMIEQAVCQRQKINGKSSGKKIVHEKLLKFVIPNFKLKCVEVPQHFVR